MRLTTVGAVARAKRRFGPAVLAEHARNVLEHLRDAGMGGDALEALAFEIAARELATVKKHRVRNVLTAAARHEPQSGM